MKINIKTFAVLKASFQSSCPVYLPEKVAVADLIDKFVQVNPFAQQVLQACKIVINKEFADNDTVLRAGQTVYVIPPSSRG